MGKRLDENQASTRNAKRRILALRVFQNFNFAQRIRRLPLTRQIFLPHASAFP
jgi:hypothetical protein